MSDRSRGFLKIHAYAPVLAGLLIASLTVVSTASAQTTKKKKHKKAAQHQQQQVAAPPQRGSAIGSQKSATALPQAGTIAQPKPTHSLETVKPPPSNDFYQAGGGVEAEYEHVVDEEIATLYKLSQQHRNSVNRGELWLRLGEEYVEKARIVEMRQQAEFEKKLKDFEAGKIKTKPRQERSASHDYNQKAVKLYEWFIKDFPRDPKVDQALFFLGYNQFELGATKLGEKYYSDLVKRFPDSSFVTESRFALGEYYFENEDWKHALENYAKVIQARQPRLNTFALYKSAWCLYRLNRMKPALNALEHVIRLSRAGQTGDGGEGKKVVNKVRLANEALKDYVPFYAEAGDPQQAPSEFARLAGDDKVARQMLERLAFVYADSGNKNAANFLFKKLIAMNPTAERAAEYQYQVVLAYATGDQKAFRNELEIWLEEFGANSEWARANSKNEKLVSDVARLQETTLRNHVLQEHQTAQNSRAPYSQKIAAAAYVQYFKYFPNSAHRVEMSFFCAELYFDMGRYEEAAKIYDWVAEKDPKGPYYAKSILNSLLALEKGLPDEQTIEAKRGKSLEPMPLDPAVQNFVKAALAYVAAYPRSEKTPDVERRVAVLYYDYNHFDEAMPLFEKIIRDNPKSANAEIAGNLLLDTYKLKGDMAGLADRAREMLRNPAIANSKFGERIRTLLEHAGYTSAEKVAASGDSLKAAKEFERFAATSKQTDLAAAARFKAATNYAKAGDLASAIRMYGMVIAVPSSDPKIRAAQNDSRHDLAKIYQDTGQLELAARQNEAYAAANPTDVKAVNAYFNAGVLYESLGETASAVRAYDIYYSKSKRADRVEVLFTEAELMRKNGDKKKAAAYYEKYLVTGGRTASHSLQAVFHLGEFAAAYGRAPKAEKQYKETIARFGRLDRAERDECVRYAVEARFKLSQATIDRIKAIKFGNTDKQQARAATDVKVLREKYISDMKEVIKYDYGPFIVAALASTGRMYDDLCVLFAKIPAPKGFNADEAAKYKALIQGQIDGFKNEARNSYQAAVEKADTLETYTPWTKIARQGLATYGGDQSVSADGVDEITADVRVSDWMGL